ncbi:unnamed protein product, partial [Prorocentrum cordatum]
PPAAGPRQPGAPPPPGAGVPRWGCRSGPGDDLPRCVGVPHPSQRLRGELLRSICAHLGEGKDQLFPALERLPGGVRARARSPPAVLTDAACAGRSRVCGASGGWQGGRSTEGPSEGRARPRPLFSLGSPLWTAGQSQAVGACRQTACFRTV